MDTLSGFLDGPRARNAFLLRSIMSPPWSLRVQDEAPLTVVAVLTGTAWIIFDVDEPQLLGPGDLAIIRGPLPYTVADDPRSPPQVIIHPDQHCTSLSGESLAEEMNLGVRTWGNSASGSTTMLTGAYTTDGEISRRLLDALPRLIVIRRASWDTPLVGMVADEIGNDDPGQEVMLDRLLDLLLIAALRTWFARADTTTPPWYHAHTDPIIGRAIRLLTNEPAFQWSVANLAAEVGLSQGRTRSPIQRPCRRTANVLAGWLASGACSRLASRARIDRDRGRASCRLQQPVHLQRRVQAPVRPQPQGSPRTPKPVGLTFERVTDAHGPVPLLCECGVGERFPIFSRSASAEVKGLPCECVVVHCADVGLLGGPKQ